MSPLDRARRAAARAVPSASLATVIVALCAMPAAAAPSPPAASAPSSAPIPPPTGNTVTIKVAVVRGKLRFVGPRTVAAGDALEIVNKTNPAKIGPLTFSLVRRGGLPRARRARSRCFTPRHICWAIATWHGVHGDGMPTIDPAEAGAPGWDTMGTTTKPGDSWFSGAERGARFAQEVTAPARTRLWFMDAIHPWLHGTIKVVAPTPPSPATIPRWPTMSFAAGFGPLAAIPS